MRVTPTRGFMLTELMITVAIVPSWRRFHCLPTAAISRGLACLWRWTGCLPTRFGWNSVVRAWATTRTAPHAGRRCPWPASRSVVPCSQRGKASRPQPQARARSRASPTRSTTEACAQPQPSAWRGQHLLEHAQGGLRRLTAGHRQAALQAPKRPALQSAERSTCRSGEAGSTTAKAAMTSITPCRQRITASAAATAITADALLKPLASPAAKARARRRRAPSSASRRPPPR